MRKFLLVVFVGLVLAINLYNVVTKVVDTDTSMTEEVTIVYTE